MGIVRARHQPFPAYRADDVMTATEPRPAHEEYEPSRGDLGGEPPAGRDLIDAVASNLSRLRRNSGIDVDRLAERSGLPSELLVALEAGRTTPSLRSLWALANAFESPFGVLISGAPCTTASFHLLRAAGSRVVDSTGGGFRTRALSAAGDPREPEVYEVTLAPGWVEEAAPHALDTFEHIVVVRGVLVVRTAESTATLTAGDVVFFRADRAHAYQNPGALETTLHLTMTYAGDWVEDILQE
jgi:transcriptional regulator with XRE-family HTH domain